MMDKSVVKCCVRYVEKCKILKEKAFEFGLRRWIRFGPEKMGILSQEVGIRKDEFGEVIRVFEGKLRLESQVKISFLKSLNTSLGAWI